MRPLRRGWEGGEPGRVPGGGLMTEAEWLASAAVTAMYNFLRDATTQHRTRWQGWVSARRFRVSERKWSLFHCACCRRIEHLLPTAEARRVIDVTERVAEGAAGQGELEAAVRASMDSCHARTET